MKKSQMNDLKLHSSADETNARSILFDLFKNNPLPDDQVLNNLGLFIESKWLSRILFFDFLYKQIINTQGVIMEFGTHWGQNSAMLSALRGIYEPFNRHRKIIGFDTFKGFPSINKKDGNSDLMVPGKLQLPRKYPEYLKKILDTHESLNPLSHIKKNEICVGDASIELMKYLKREPHTIIALAYFDFDIYKPTKDCLKLIKNRITKGSIIGFDELNDPDSPGETLALMEEIGLQNIRLQRYQFCSRVSYYVVE
ncbi:hypothetical protein OA530_04405 [Pelagibacteraceae bacterium]|nr:hypothetical protein [Pelagibacteraceae bacterium]